MAKVRVHYVCQQCGADSGRWFGRCAGCGAWNSCVEEKAVPQAKEQKRTAELVRANPPQPITEVVGGKEDRIETGIDEFDRTLGGGIVPGMAALIGGDPGIGKSALVLQGCPVGISGYESAVCICRRISSADADESTACWGTGR